MGLWTQRRNRADSDHPTSPDVIGYILTARGAWKWVCHINELGYVLLICRVKKWHSCHSFPLEQFVRAPPHTAQASAKPLCRSRWHNFCCATFTILTCSLLVRCRRMGFMGQLNVKPFLTQAGNILQIVLPGIRANFRLYTEAVDKSAGNVPRN